MSNYIIRWKVDETKLRIISEDCIDANHDAKGSEFDEYVMCRSCVLERVTPLVLQGLGIRDAEI